jgi:proteasome-associated ATPase
MARPDNFYDMVLTIDGSRMLMNPWDRPQFRSQEEELKFRLAEANQKLAEQDTFLKGITEGALVLGTVLSVEPDGKRGIVSAGPQKVACNLPKGAKAGDTVRVVPKTSQPLDVVAAPVDAGEVCTVAKVHGDLIEISSGMGTRTVARGSVECEPGTRIVVDSSFSIALRSLGSSEDNYLFAQETSVSWEDIGGLEAAKEAIREAIEFPITHADLYRHYGKQPSRGVLLYGPPGCGKTMLGKAAATALQKAHGGAGNGGFIYVKGPEVLSKWVGEAEATVRGLFAQARAYKAKTGHSAVLFIDEAEALLASRNQDGYRGGIQATLVPAFLAEMDGLEDSGAFVILSTNRPDSLDSAITRDGRIDRKVQVTRPDKAQALRIFELAVRGRPSAADDLAKRLCDAVFTSTEPVVSASAVGITVSLNLADCMSGALVAGIVNRATEEAMRRDRESGVAVPSGINDSDVRKAVSSAALEMRHLDWRDELVMKAQQVAGRELIGAAAKAHAEMN